MHLMLNGFVRHGLTYGSDYSGRPLLTKYPDIDGLVQDGRNSIANALELSLSCTNPSIWYVIQIMFIWL